MVNYFLPSNITSFRYCNVVGLLNSLTVDQVTDSQTFDKEIAFQKCDKKTRETRQLVKMIAVIDLAEFSLFGNGNDKRFFKSQGDSSKIAAKVYPQLLGKTVLINPPSFMKVLWAAFSIFMPQSALDKVTICPATDTFDPETDNVSKCPFVQKWCGNAGALAQVPAFLGGTAECPVLLKTREECPDTDMTTVTVDTRSDQTVELKVKEGGSTLHWELLITENGVEFSVTFKSSKGGSTVLMEPTKIEDKPALLRGDIAVPEAGVLHVKFANDGWIQSTTFQHKFVVHDAAETAAAQKEASDIAGMLGKMTM